MEVFLTLFYALNLDWIPFYASLQRPFYVSDVNRHIWPSYWTKIKTVSRCRGTTRRGSRNYWTWGRNCINYQAEPGGGADIYFFCLTYNSEQGGVRRVICMVNPRLTTCRNWRNIKMRLTPSLSGRPLLPSGSRYSGENRTLSLLLRLKLF